MRSAKAKKARASEGKSARCVRLQHRIGGPAPQMGAISSAHNTPAWEVPPARRPSSPCPTCTGRCWPLPAHAPTLPQSWPYLRMQRCQAVALGNVVLNRCHLGSPQLNLVLPTVLAWVHACKGRGATGGGAGGPREGDATVWHCTVKLYEAGEAKKLTVQLLVPACPVSLSTSQLASKPGRQESSRQATKQAHTYDQVEPAA